MRPEKHIDYVEIPTIDLNSFREFFSELYGWTFQEWGDDYYSFSDGRIDGGLRRASDPAPASGILLIFYSEDLERDFQRVQDLGAMISKPIFSFPGGRRFHFVEPSGTEFAIWSEQSEPTGE